MPFINPGIFWTGLAAVSAPVVIHLLSRRRFRVRYWAAMRFLLESLKQNRRRLRMEELILLALRCLIVLILAMGLARFTGCGRAGLLGGEGASRTVVYILDDSPSMTQTAGGTSAFASAKEDLASAVARLGGDDRLAVLRTGAAEDDEPVLGLGFAGELEMEPLTARLKAIPPSDVGARVETALATAERILSDVDGPKWVVLMSDFRRHNYAGGEVHAPLRERFADLRELEVGVVAMDYSRPPRDNLTVRSVELLENYAVADVPVRVRVSVRNNSPRVARDVEVHLRILTPSPSAGEVVEASLPTRTIASIEPGGTGTSELPVTFPRAGSTVLSAELADDELSADNVAHLAVDVRDSVRVLVVDADADTDGRGSMYFTRAIDPNRDGGYGYRPDVIAPGRLAETDLDDYHVVVMMDVPGFSASVVAGDDGEPSSAVYPQIAALERFVESGGGLAVFTGPRVNPRFYNRHLWSGGEGLLPVRLGQPAGANDMPRGFVRLDADSIRREDPLRVFAGDGAGLTRLIRFRGFTRTEPGDDDDRQVNVLARFGDRDRSPAVVSRRFGSGRVMLLTTTADTRWTDWPQEPLGTYVAAMADMVTGLARPQPEALTGRVGEPVVHDLGDPLRDARATLTTPLFPAVDKLTLATRTEQRGRSVRYERADAAGVYTLELAPPVGEPRRVLFARNVDPSEGDLTQAGREQLAAALGSDDFRYVSRAGARSAEAAVTDDTRDYWKWAIAAVLAMLAVETLLARRFGHYGDG